MADQPMSEQPGVPGVPGSTGTPDAATLFRAWLMGQQNTQGMTQMGPQVPGLPAPRQPYQNKQQSVAQPGNNRQSLQNLGVAASNLIGQIGNQLQERKQRELTQLFTTYTQSLKGVTQAQSQLQDAQKMSQQAMQEFQQAQTPEAKQAAAQKLKQIAAMNQKAQQDLNTNRTNLKDMFTGPKGEKNHKTLAKGMGIDDKNEGTPERQAAKQALQKSMGIDATSASLASRMPQTLGPSVQAQQQKIAQQYGGGKPPTGDKILDVAQKQQHEAGIAQRAVMKDQLAAAFKGLKYDDQNNLIPMKPEEMSPVIQSKLAADQAKEQLTKAQTEYQRVRTQLAPEQAKLAEAHIKALEGNLMMRQKEFGIKVEDEARKRLETEMKGANISGTPDVAGITGGRPLQSWAQKTIAETMPVSEQIDGLIQKIQDLGLAENNQAGYLFLPRLAYAAGLGSDEGKLASEISNISLIQVTGAARVLKGSSRAFAALEWAGQHLPDAWKSSPKQMLQQLKFVKENLGNIVNDSITYGVKNMKQGEARNLVGKGKTAPPAQSGPIVVSPEDMR